jgi:hypothetical protein
MANKTIRQLTESTSPTTTDAVEIETSGNVSRYVQLSNLLKGAIASTAAGDIMYHNGTNWVRLAKGTAFQALRMNSGATAPEWGQAAGDVIQIQVFS